MIEVVYFEIALNLVYLIGTTIMLNKFHSPLPQLIFISKTIKLTQFYFRIIFISEIVYVPSLVFKV